MTNEPKKATVLIVEDKADVRNFAARVLELEGYHVLQAVVSEQGMRMVRKNPINLVLLDLRLPGSNGWTMLEEMKNDTVLSSIPVIVFTASAMAAYRKRALRLGAADYLIKPLSAARLRTTVARVLHGEG